MALNKNVNVYQAVSRIDGRVMDIREFPIDNIIEAMSRANIISGNFRYRTILCELGIELPNADPEVLKLMFKTCIENSDKNETERKYGVLEYKVLMILKVLLEKIYIPEAEKYKQEHPPSIFGKLFKKR